MSDDMVTLRKFNEKVIDLITKQKESGDLASKVPIIDFSNKRIAVTKINFDKDIGLVAVALKEDDKLPIDERVEDILMIMLVRDKETASKFARWMELIYSQIELDTAMESKASDMV